MSKTIRHRVEAEVEITLHDGAPDDVISRALTEEWQRYLYKFDDREDVLDHLAYNAVANGVEDVARLDGWADIDRGLVTMRVNVL